MGKQFGCELLECDQFILADVVLFVLCEAVNKEGPDTQPEYKFAYETRPTFPVQDARSAA